MSTAVLICYCGFLIICARATSDNNESNVGIVLSREPPLQYSLPCFVILNASACNSAAMILLTSISAVLSSTGLRESTQADSGILRTKFSSQSGELYNRGFGGLVTPLRLIPIQLAPSGRQDHTTAYSR